MKGKGKGKCVSESKDCPLQFLDFTQTDHTRICPRYTSVLNRNENEGVANEDLDTLQLELEVLLVSVMKRRTQLDQEMQILVSWQDRIKDKKSPGKSQQGQSQSNSQPVGQSDMGKRSRPANGKPNKRFKGGGGSSSKVQPPTTGGRPKSKNVQAKMQEYEFTDSPMDVPTRTSAPKNDAPNRFWTSLEPYFAEISNEDLKVLEDLIKSHDEDSEYYKIPALGKHYSLKWAQEDMLEEQKEGSRINDKRRGLSNNNSNVNAAAVVADRLLKRAEKEHAESEDTTPFGSLTQRLVSCLIEENLMASFDDSLETQGKETPDDNVTVAPTKGNFIKSLNINNTVALEKRIRRELEEQGILDAEESGVGGVDSSEDEILSELKRCQAELKAISSHNLSQAKRVLRMAKEEIAQQEIRRKLQLVDAEVMDCYRKIVGAHQKKRSPTKKEKEQAWKALKDREQILKQLDSASPNP